MANEILDYARDNMPGKDLTRTVLMSAGKALFTSIVLVFAAVKLLDMGNPTLSETYRQSVALYLAIFLPSYIIFLFYYLVKETPWKTISLKGMFYTEELDSSDLWAALLISWLLISIWSLIFQGIVMLAMWYPGLATTILINSGLASILILEFVFTAIYSYMDLTIWVKECKFSKATIEEIEQQREERELLSEIAGRVRDDLTRKKP